MRRAMRWIVDGPQQAQTKPRSWFIEKHRRCSSCIWQHLEQPRPPPCSHSRCQSHCPPLLGWLETRVQTGSRLPEHMRRPSSRVRTSDQSDIIRPASSLLPDGDSCWGPFFVVGIFLSVYQSRLTGLRHKHLSSCRFRFLFRHISLAPSSLYVVSPGFTRVLSAGCHQSSHLHLLKIISMILLILTDNWIFSWHRHPDLHFTAPIQI